MELPQGAVSVQHTPASGDSLEAPSAAASPKVIIQSMVCAHRMPCCGTAAWIVSL